VALPTGRTDSIGGLPCLLDHALKFCQCYSFVQLLFRILIHLCNSKFLNLISNPSQMSKLTGLILYFNFSTTSHHGDSAGRLTIEGTRVTNHCSSDRATCHRDLVVAHRDSERSTWQKSLEASITREYIALAYLRGSVELTPTPRA